jgi:glyoxylase-like metal-dependent hydrolase (beta-lactamase superfamily II)/ferredoxin
MADRKRRRAENASGDWYVDSTCIDCDTCRWMAPAIFARAEGQSAVARQPQSAAEQTAAMHALISCPTASIGTLSKTDPSPYFADFPLPIDGPVHHCGFHHEGSFGATAYFLRRDEGNVLVDSPRFARPLVERIAALGGVRYMFLTHRDDVADHEKWAQRFGCERVIHAADAAALGAPPEISIEGDDPVALAPDLLVIPTPGHTRGSACLRFASKYLFTGDHLAYSATLGHVYAFRSACWYDWKTLVASTRRLLEHEFEWILPGHGRRCRHPAAAMPVELRRAITWMEGTAPDPW